MLARQRHRPWLRYLPTAASLAITACGSSESSTRPSRSHHAPQAPSHEDAELQAVAAIHGGAGPWAVAGYRMGRYALTTLGLESGSFDLEVTHYTPRQVQYSCIADGAAAATGASMGKLNLALTEAPLSDLRTVYSRKSTGQALTLRVTTAFTERFSAVPSEQLADAGRQVLHLRDEEIFEHAP